MIPVILVSGKNGQLGKELQELAASNTNLQFIFFDKEELDITNESTLKQIFQKKFSIFFYKLCGLYRR